MASPASIFLLSPAHLCCCSVVGRARRWGSWVVGPTVRLGGGVRWAVGAPPSPPPLLLDQRGSPRSPLCSSKGCNAEHEVQAGTWRCPCIITCIHAHIPHTLPASAHVRDSFISQVKCKDLDSPSHLLRPPFVLGISAAMKEAGASACGHGVWCQSPGSRGFLCPMLSVCWGQATPPGRALGSFPVKVGWCFLA